MYVKLEGTGNRTFIGIHGWAGNHRTFRRLMAYRPEDVSFYSPDLPGYGESPPPSLWTFDAVADELGVFVQERAKSPVTLVGNCGGALFALAVAKKLPSLVNRVVLIDPFAYAPLYFRIFTWGTFGRYAYMSTFANPLGRWFTNSALRNKRSSETNLTAAFGKVNHDVAHRYIGMMCRLGNIECFRGLPVPADIVYGEKTFKAVRAALPLWRATLPNAAFHELKGAGHEPIREATEALANVIFHGGTPSFSYQHGGAAS